MCQFCETKMTHQWQGYIHVQRRVLTADELK